MHLLTCVKGVIGEAVGRADRCVVDEARVQAVGAKKGIGIIAAPAGHTRHQRIHRTIQSLKNSQEQSVRRPFGTCDCTCKSVGMARRGMLRSYEKFSGGPAGIG